MRKIKRKTVVSAERKLRWLNCADSSYLATRLLFRYGTNKLFRDIYYMSQQTIEKYFKAYKVSQASPFKGGYDKVNEPPTIKKEQLIPAMKYVDENEDPANLELIHDLVKLLNICAKMQSVFYTIKENPQYMEFIKEINQYDTWRYPEDGNQIESPDIGEVSITKLHIFDAIVCNIRSWTAIPNRGESLINQIIEKNLKNDINLDQLRDILKWENQQFNNLTNLYCIC